MTENTRQTFVVDLLTMLRQQRFRPRAWGELLRLSWRFSCQTAGDNPALTRSWRNVTGLIALLTLVAVLSNWLSLGGMDTLRLLPGLLLCVVWQQSDLFWHLGLNRVVQDDRLLQRLGIANTLTWVRALGAAYLFGRLLGGLPIQSGLALAIFLGGIVTDILDGQIARRTATQSKLGQIADAEVDLCLTLALTIVLLHNGVLALWVAIALGLRFLIPLTFALVSYLALTQPLRFGSTWWGKAAGLAQCLYFLDLLAPSALTNWTGLLRIPLLLAMLCLFACALYAQFAVLIQAQRDERKERPRACELLQAMGDKNQ